MKRNTLTAQITLATLICLATAHTSQAMQEPQITLESADGQSFVLPKNIAFVSDYVRALKTGGFREAAQEGPVMLKIPGDELKIIVQIMHVLHEHQGDAKAQANAIAQMPLSTSQNIGALIYHADFLQLPESCVTGLIDRLAEFVNQQVTAGQDVEIPLNGRNLLTQLCRTYFLKYEQELELANTEGKLVDIGGFSIRELLDAGKRFPVLWNRSGKIGCNLENRKINSLEGLLDIPGINKCQRLLLNKNQISSIQSGAFQTLPKLRFLYLADNRIKSIQAGAFQELPKLTDLNLSSNEITLIQPGTFQRLSNLGTLNLTNNKITAIRPDAFQGLPNLLTLDLTKNQITSIELGAFGGLSMLNDLCLENNQITAIQPGTFQGLSNLEWLDLNNNQIKSIQSDTFQGLTKLLWLCLNYNRITSIQTDAFRWLLNLGELLLESNSLSPAAIEKVQGGLPPECELRAADQREETPEERRKQLAEAAMRRLTAPAA